MVDDEKAEPSLEPPKLFGRRKKAQASPPPAAADLSAEVPEPPAPAPEPDPTTAEVAPSPAPAEPRPLFEDEPVEPEPANEIEAEPASGSDGPPPRRRFRTARRGQHTAVLDTPDAAEEPAAVPEDDEEPTPGRRAARPPREEPILTGYRAAAAAGFLAGALAVLLTALTLRLCELVRGTSSCGSPGFVLLVLIFAAVVATGGYLLRYLRVPDPFSTSFLAVGMVAVVALLFLIDVILAWPMIIVIPLLSALMYVGSTWVTTTFVDPPKD